jgi:hypothetical protein
MASVTLSLITPEYITLKKIQEDGYVIKFNLFIVAHLVDILAIGGV